MRKDSDLVLGVIQARCSSTRLPNKSMTFIHEKSMFEWVYRRALNAKSLSGLVVATSTAPSDDKLYYYCRQRRIPVYRGSLDDVLLRYYKLAEAFKAKHVVRLTGDCPLIDPKVIDKVVNKHIAHDMDYTSNVIKPTYPDGLDVECISFYALADTHQNAVSEVDRQHVTQYILKRQDYFRCLSVENDKDLSSHRWTVDEKEDLEFVMSVYDYFVGKQKKQIFYMSDILKFIQLNPNIVVNDKFKRNEGLLK